MPAKLKARDDLAIVELDGEAVIYDEEHGSLHHLNPTATLVFSLCDGSADLRQLTEELSETFSVPADDMEGQLAELVEELRDQGLLKSP